MDDDYIELLKMINIIAYNFKIQKHKWHSLFHSKKSFNSQYQAKFLSMDGYRENFKNNVQVIDNCGGLIGLYPETYKVTMVDLGNDIELATQYQIKEVQDNVTEIYLVTGFLLGTDRKRHGKLIKYIQNEYRMGKEKWPENINDAYKFLLNWKKNKKQS